MKATDTNTAEDISKHEDTAPPQRNTGDSPRATWPISLNNLRVNIAHMEQENKQLLVDCYLWCIQHDIAKPEFATAIGSVDNTVYRWITGRYINPITRERLDISPRFVAAMRLWLKEQKALATKRSEFIRTPTAVKAMRAPLLAMESKTPVILSGPSHIGKTWAMEHFAETHNHGRTVYVRFGAASGLGGMLSEIASRIGVSPNAPKDKMIKHIKAAITSEMLFIFDEVHLLMNTYRKESFFACIEVLRELYDRSGCGMVFCMTSLGRDKIETEKRRELEQVFRRGVHRITLPHRPLVKDLELILGYHGLELPARKVTIIVKGISEEPYEVIRQLATHEGLKAITERVRYGKKIAEKAGQDLAWEHFITAHLIIAQNDTPEDDWK